MRVVFPFVLLAMAAPLSAQQVHPATPAAKSGQTVFDAKGSRLGVVDRVEQDGSVIIISDGRFVRLPSNTLTSAGGKIGTTLTKREVVKL